MRICDLTVPELNRYREMCNFLDDELIYFDMKSRDKSNIQIAIALNVSEGQIPRIGGRVKEKMRRIGEFPDKIVLDT